MNDLIVIGGGWAGLAAATRAVQVGLKTTVYESAPHLGGRCFSYYDKNFQENLDNGPHLFIRGYVNTLELLEIWNAKDELDFEFAPVIACYYGKSQKRLLRTNSASNLGSVINLALFTGISFLDKIKMIRAIRRMIAHRNFNSESEPTLLDYLRQFGIGEENCGYLWKSLSLAVLNGEMSTVGAWTFIRAIQNGLLTGGILAQFGFLRNGFKNIFNKATEYLESNGCQFELKSNIRRLTINSNKEVTGIELNGRKVLCKKVVLAVPPNIVSRILPSWLIEDDFFSRFRKFEFSTIVSIYINFDREVISDSMVLFPEGNAHWVFGRGEPDDKGWSKVSCVISNVLQAGDISNIEYGNIALRDLRKYIPLAIDAKVLNLKVIRSKKATVLLKPKSNKIRPDSPTPVEGLFLAGDWCNTGIPATIESAVRSGFEAANML